jgi:hypothetical protein
MSTRRVASREAATRMNPPAPVLSCPPLAYVSLISRPYSELGCSVKESIPLKNSSLTRKVKPNTKSRKSGATVT